MDGYGLDDILQLRPLDAEAIRLWLSGRMPRTIREPGQHWSEEQWTFACRRLPPRTRERFPASIASTVATDFSLMYVLSATYCQLYERLRGIRGLFRGRRREVLDRVLRDEHMANLSMVAHLCAELWALSAWFTGLGRLKDKHNLRDEGSLEGCGEYLNWIDPFGATLLQTEHTTFLSRDDETPKGLEYLKRTPRLPDGDGDFPWWMAKTLLLGQWIEKKRSSLVHPLPTCYEKVEELYAACHEGKPPELIRFAKYALPDSNRVTVEDSVWDEARRLAREHPREFGGEVIDDLYAQLSALRTSEVKRPIRANGLIRIMDKEFSNAVKNWEQNDGD